jgi:kumamolisin
MKHVKRLTLPMLGLLAIFSLITGTFYFHTGSSKAASPDLVALAGSAPLWTRTARLLNRHRPDDKVTIGVGLRTSDQQGQIQLLSSLYNPHSPLYHHWLTSAAFSARFAPPASVIAATTSYLTGAGLKLTASPDTTLILATGTFAQVEAAFHTQIDDYSLTNGSQFYANTSNIILPKSLSGSVVGVYGLNNFAAFVSYDKIETQGNSGPEVVPPPYGGGPFGSGLTPSQIAGIYNADPVYTKLNTRGEGVTMAVFELSQYKASDIAKYVEFYHLRHVPLINRPVLGGTTSHRGAAEATLDIQLQIAMAQGASKILVYQSPATELGGLAQYLQIAKDNRADVVSTSWGVPCEYGVTAQFTISESQIFLQMAAQGQSMFAAAGDSGAYGCTRAGVALPPALGLQIGDPNNQPFVTAAGGTSFQRPDNVTTFDPKTEPHPSYPGTNAELSWGTTPCDAMFCPRGGGGGGVSRIWASGDYVVDNLGIPRPGVIQINLSQTGAYCNQQPGVLCRQSPDVSLNANPRTGYSIYCTDSSDTFCTRGEFTTKSGWLRLGGTSCAAPLWSGIAALADSYHGARLGLFNYIVYRFDSITGYASQLHDITLFGNGFYSASPGYDMATGVGTPNIFNFVTA